MESIHCSGMIFGESKAGEQVRFDKKKSSCLLFLLKGGVQIKSGWQEVCMTRNEFVMVNHFDLPECTFTHSSHYVLVRLDEVFSFSFGEGGDEATLQIQPIHTDLSVLLRYMLGTMPLNEEIRHHFIPRIIRLIMRRYSFIHDAIDSTV